MIRTKLLASLCAASLLLTACAGTSKESETATPGSGMATTTKAAAEFTPFSITNCGFEMTIAKPPTRVATLMQSATENLFALEQQEKMIGTASLRDAVSPKWQKDYEAIPVISKTAPTNEELRDYDPDFIVTTQQANFTKQLGGTREEWYQHGIPTFVSNTECGKEGETGFDLIFRDYEQLGKILSAEDQAQKLIAEQKLAIKAATMESGKKLSFLFVVAKDGAKVYVDGGKGIANDISSITGSVNAFGNLPETRNDISMEAFADANPDYIVVADLSGRGRPMDTAAEKIEVLENHPATKNMQAVQQKNYIVVPGAALDASVRSVEALQIIADHLK
ncbi:ABC transporter substrate-binding protein [Corynebacterium caspium]|uniref:ABC transporter substrate-binding protein n=1 Tax=Corynebacterium caspium TaxID=234828 RepID=UPI00058E4E58|nr:ABC transporter substrate-binding protein [Corynebacterium caspium]